MLTWEKPRARLRAYQSYFDLQSYSCSSSSHDAVVDGPDLQIANHCLEPVEGASANRASVFAASTATRPSLKSRASAGDLARLRSAKFWPSLRRQRSQLPLSPESEDSQQAPLSAAAERPCEVAASGIFLSSFVAMTTQTMATSPESPRMKQHQRHPTMPSTPSQEQKPAGFFKRILHRRQTSSLDTMTPPSTPEKAPLRNPSYPIPQDAVSSPSDQTDAIRPDRPIAIPPIVMHEADHQPGPERTDSSHTNGAMQQAGDQNSEFRGVKFSIDDSELPSNRPRRTSSARRASIYQRADDNGAYEEGVDTGVGSKARKLSMALGSEELQVGESSLTEHFSLAVRKGGKKEIGEGGAGIVRLMKSKAGSANDDRVVAVKEFRPRDADEETEADYERKIKSEYGIAKACVHPNIVKTLWLCTDHGKWFHVMEYCQLGDLCDVVSKGHMTYNDKNCMFKQLLRGIDYLHSRGIAHRDIKMENVLVTKDGCLKIADFGTGEVFSGLHPGLRNCRRQSIADPDEPVRMCSPGWVGSYPYMAPEIRQRKGNYDPRYSDLWSCGIFLLQLMAEGCLWENCDPTTPNWVRYAESWERYLDRYEDGEIWFEGRPLPDITRVPRFQKLGPHPTKVLFLRLCHPIPEKRWTAKRILEDPIVVNYECCQQVAYTEGDDLRKRERKARHNHVPPEKKKSVLGHLAPGAS